MKWTAVCRMKVYRWKHILFLKLEFKYTYIYNDNGYSRTERFVSTILIYAHGFTVVLWNSTNPRTNHFYSIRRRDCRRKKGGRDREREGAAADAYGIFFPRTKYARRSVEEWVVGKIASSGGPALFHPGKKKLYFM